MAATKRATRAEKTEDAPRHKDFGSPVRIDQLPPLSFDLAGQTFHCRPAIRTKRMLQFVKQADSGDGGAGQAVIDFLESVLAPEDLDAWQELIDGDEYVVDAALLSDIVMWLIEQYAARPTQQ